ncbi:hypothetical protein B0T18DRAFT_402274 [Schizothecium vesticola]|uniref:Uncharacterized protein n=1 Tax=Schizothecium vesticola TaxID=314040 RepID=A0AA40KA53_9PEZI|nr:hypothetical protein B0T18DRAFT_402274 [Schizothecium vesticola]
MLGETPVLHFGMQSIQEYVPSVEDLVLCMDALQEMSRPGRLFHMRRILSQMEEDAVLAVLVPDASSLPYALLRETVEEQGPWNRWLETRKIEYVTGAQAFLPLEPVAEWEAAVAPYAKAFVVMEAVDPYPIPRGFESVYDWMVLEMAPVLTQLDNERGARQAFLRRYKEKVEECLTPRFGEMGYMGIRVRCLFAVRGSTGGGDSSRNNDSPGPATPLRGGGSGSKYVLRSDSGGVGNYGGRPSVTSVREAKMRAMEILSRPGTAEMIAEAGTRLTNGKDNGGPGRGEERPEDTVSRVHAVLSKLSASRDAAIAAEAEMMGTALARNRQPHESPSPGRAGKQSEVLDTMMESSEAVADEVEKIRGSIERPARGPGSWMERFSEDDVFDGTEEEFEAMLARTALGSEEGRG